MYSNHTRRFSYLMIIVGSIFILIGLWYLLVPFSMKSSEPKDIYMTLTTIRIIFPIVGVILVFIGNLTLAIIRESHKELQLLRNELMELRKSIQKLQ